MTFEVKKATRKQARARIALCGPSGSGKTMSALRLAQGLVAGQFDALNEVVISYSDIGVIDTERKSASLYSDVVPFVTIEMEPPYSPERYRQAIEALEKHGCQVIIIDQISHEWSGLGGVLEKVDALQLSGKNKMQAWAKMTPEHQSFIDALLRSNAHIIATMRTKTDWHIDEQTRKPTKMGTTPVQREGTDYEFTAVLNIDIGHSAYADKDRTGVFADIHGKLDESWGRKLAAWLNQGEAYAPEVKTVVVPGTYVKPADYVEPPDQPRNDVTPAEPASAGFDVASRANELATRLVSDEQVAAIVREAKDRAKALGLTGRNAYVEITKAVLLGYDLEHPRFVSARDYDDVISAIRIYS